MTTIKINRSTETLAELHSAFGSDGSEPIAVRLPALPKDPPPEYITADSIFPEAEADAVADMLADRLNTVPGWVGPPPHSPGYAARLVLQLEADIALLWSLDRSARDQQNALASLRHVAPKSVDRAVRRLQRLRRRWAAIEAGLVRS